MERTVWLGRLQVGLRLDAYPTGVSRESDPYELRGSYEEAVEDRAWKVRGVSSHCGETTTVRSIPDEAGEIARIYHIMSSAARIKRRGGIGDTIENRVLYHFYCIPARVSRDEKRIDPHDRLDVDVSSFSWFDFSV